MYKECKTQRAQERRVHIARCLIAMMEREHFNQITITALCEEAQVPRKGFYRYFDTKEDVFNLMVDTLMRQCIDYCHLDLGSATEVNIERLTLCFQFWLEQRAFFDAAKNSDMITHMLTRIIHFYGMHLFPQQSFDALSGDQMRTLFSVSGMVSVLMQWYGSGFRCTPEEMAALTLEMLEKPLILKTVTNVPLLGSCAETGHDL